MTSVLYLPPDAFEGSTGPDFDLAADYLELGALLSSEGQSLSEDIVDALELAAEREYENVDAEMTEREEIAAGAVARMSSRKRVLASSYPFEISAHGDVIVFTGEQPNLGQTAYIVSLVLSNLKFVSPILGESDVHPTPAEVRSLRQWFQYLATAAMAAEVGGPAWSFGFPRPDHTGFLAKLREVWGTLRDGVVSVDPSAPPDPKDDQVDIFSWKVQRDGLPGFLLAAAQVATGSDWKDKSIKHHVDKVFGPRWFSPIPVTEMVAYHVIPFARPEEKFRDDVLVLGNVLHRLRVPYRVAEAVDLVASGVSVEGFDLLRGVAEWVKSYVERARAL